jgi:hypothetical protein
MSETKYTPGPWSWGAKYIAKPISKRVVCVNEYDEECTTDQVYYDLLAHCMPDSYDSPQWEANARLMAAAPELLEALQMYLVEVPIDEVCDYAEQCKAKARAAIAKALGEAACPPSSPQ